MRTSLGPAGNLQVAVGLQFRGGLVVDDFVGAEDVVAVVDHDIAGEGPGVAHAGLALGLPVDGHSGRGRGFRLGDGQHFLAGVVGELSAGIGLNLRSVLGALANAEGCWAGGNALVNVCPPSCR